MSSDAPGVGGAVDARRRRLLGAAPAAGLAVALSGRTIAGTTIASSAALLLSGCALPLTRGAVPAGAASVPAPAELRAPRVRVGDRWRYRQINLYNGSVVDEFVAEATTLAPTLRVRITSANGAQRPDEVYAGAWNLLEDSGYDLPMAFARPLPLLPAPPALGASASVSTVYRVPPYEREYYWSEWIGADAWERILVPAGEFDCLRISRRISFTHSDLFRVGSQRQETLWYAPQVNRWVQRQWTGFYIIPGGRRGARAQEDYVRWQLLEYIPAPVAQG